MYPKNNHFHGGLTDARCQQLIAEIKKHSLLFGAIVGLVLETGSRPKELLTLTWGDFDPDSKTVALRSAKRLTTRSLSLSDDLVQQILDIQPCRAREAEAIFTPEQTAAAYTQLRIVAGDVGLPNIRWNDLRIQFVVKLLNSDLPPGEVLDRAGYTLVNLLKGKVT